MERCAQPSVCRSGVPTPNRCRPCYVAHSPVPHRKLREETTMTTTTTGGRGRGVSPSAGRRERRGPARQPHVPAEGGRRPVGAASRGRSCRTRARADPSHTVPTRRRPPVDVSAARPGGRCAWRAGARVRSAPATPHHCSDQADNWMGANGAAGRCLVAVSLTVGGSRLHRRFVTPGNGHELSPCRPAAEPTGEAIRQVRVDRPRRGSDRPVVDDLACEFCDGLSTAGSGRCQPHPGLCRLDVEEFHQHALRLRDGDGGGPLSHDQQPVTASGGP